MEVRYTVTLEDYVAFNLYIVRKSGAGRVAYLVMWLLVPLLSTAGAIRALQLGGEPAAGSLAVVAIFWLCFIPYSYRSALARNARAVVTKTGGRGIIGERTLILSEASVVGISEVARTEVKWDNITGVDVVDDRAYILFGGLCWILPRTGFASDEEYEAVRDFALRKLDGQSDR